MASTLNYVTRLLSLEPFIYGGTIFDVIINSTKNCLFSATDVNINILF